MHPDPPWVPNATASHQHLVIAIAILAVGKALLCVYFSPDLALDGCFCLSSKKQQQITVGNQPLE